MLWDMYHNLLQWFLAQVWHRRIFCRVANWNKDKSAFIGRALEKFAQEAHRIGGMSQGRKTGEGQGGEQHTDRNSDRLLHIVMFDFSLAPIWERFQSVDLSKYDH